MSQSTDLTRDPRYWTEARQSLRQMTLEPLTGHSHSKPQRKNEPRPKSYANINSKWVADLNVKPVAENTGREHLDLGLVRKTENVWSEEGTRS